MADFNIFGSAPEYLTGLLGQQGVEDLQKKALTTGLINAAIGYIAQPKNQRLGGALPYVGRALQAGMTGAQGVYDQGLKNFEVQQKIDEIKRQKEQRAAYDAAVPKLFRTTPAQYQETQVSGGGYMPGEQVGNMPNFNVSGQYAAPTMERTMISPEIRTLDPNAALELAMSGDPRAASLIKGLDVYSELTKNKQTSLFDKPNIKDYTSASIQKYQTTGNPADLQPIAKPNDGTAFIQNYEYAVSRGYKGSPEDWQRLGIVTAQQYQQPYKQTEQAATEAATEYKYGRPKPQINVPQTVTMQDVADTAKSSGKTTAQVLQDMKTKGIKVQGAK